MHSLFLNPSNSNTHLRLLCVIFPCFYFILPTRPYPIPSHPIALGMITANIMFAAPLQDVRKATKRGDLGPLNPTPWAVMLGNCLGWVIYSFLINNYFVFFANAPGFLLAMYFNIQTFKLQSMQRHAQSIRQSLIVASRNQQGLSPPLAAVTTEDTATTTTATTTTKVVFENNTLTTAIKQPPDHDDNGDNDDEERILMAAAAVTVTATTANNDDDIHNTNNSMDLESPRNNNHNDNLTLKEYATIVWNVTAQKIPAPFVSHDYLVLAFVSLWLVTVTIVVFGSTEAPTVFTSSVNELVVGIVVNCNLLFFYGAPLSTIWTVLSTKSSKTIHIPTIITNTLNGVFWFAFGVGVQDWFIAVPNGLGALLGSIQITLCIIFPRDKKPLDSKTMTPAVEPIPTDKVNEQIETVEILDEQKEDDENIVGTTAPTPKLEEVLQSNDAV